MDSVDGTGSLSRRTFMAASAAAVAAAALSGCDSGGDDSGTVPTTSPATATGAADTTESATTEPTTTTEPTPTTEPPTTEPGTSATTPVGSVNDLQHIVILLQENRSFDHYFGTRPGVAGFASTAAGQTYRNPYPDHPDGYLIPYRYDSTTTSAQCGPDPNHSWEAQHAAWNGGANDGFATAMGAHALGYFNREDLPYYWALADEFTLCDHYFCSVLGPTNPNRHMAMTGTIDPGGLGGGPAVDNSGVAYTWETYPERLQTAGISWRVYHEVDDFDDNSVKFFTQYQGLADGDPLYDNAMVNRPAGAFAADVAAGDLAQVTWLVAPTVISEHPPWAPSVGEDFTAQALAALMANEALWATTAFVLTYDENGGFFDHLPPPVPPPGTADEFVGDAPIGLGFRVPTIIASPWTRRAPGSGTGADGARVVDSTFDHTSLLRLIETRFGVSAPLISAWRRETCADLSEAFDFTSANTTVPSLPDTPTRAAEFANGVCTDKPAAVPPAVQVAATLDA